MHSDKNGARNEVPYQKVVWYWSLITTGPILTYSIGMCRYDTCNADRKSNWFSAKWSFNAVILNNIQSMLTTEGQSIPVTYIFEEFLMWRFPKLFDTCLPFSSFTHSQLAQKSLDTLFVQYIFTWNLA